MPKTRKRYAHQSEKATLGTPQTARGHRARGELEAGENPCLAEGDVDAARHRETEEGNARPAVALRRISGLGGLPARHPRRDGSRGELFDEGNRRETETRLSRQIKTAHPRGLSRFYFGTYAF